MTDLAFIEIAPDMAPAIYVENGLDSFLEKIRAGVNEVPDLSTAKGRARIASLAAQVSRSKTAVEKPGRDYLKRRRQEEAESARLAEQKRIAEEEARRAADKEHRRSINRQAIADLIESGLTQEMAEKALIAIASGKVSAVSIKY